ncbi:MAG: hypothetical protein A4E65_00048 [Syntrophorhabdus sp. PtaU1.Bin153]|nr:MAG: hypothetical protein A4E65_00048 [Syntrophorhabdus sp. PtaU1.Bin153]
MRRSRLTLSFLFLAGLSWCAPYAFAQSGDWVLYFTNSGGDRFYYDSRSISTREAPGAQAQSVRKAKNIVDVRYKAVSGRENSVAGEIHQRVEFDCARIQYRRLELEEANSDSKQRSHSISANWSEIIPGSSIDYLFKTMCIQGAGQRVR